MPPRDDGALCEDAVALDDVSLAPGTCSSGSCRRLPIVAAGGYHACAVLADGGMRCWGRALQGALGRGDEVNVGDGFGSSVARAGALALPSVESVGLGFANTCAIAADGLRCWGDNTGGALGTGDFEHRGTTPATIASSLPVLALGADFVPSAVANSVWETCALSQRGDIKCWGEKVSGYPGIPSVGTPGTISIAQVGAVSLGSDAGPFVTETIDIGFTHVCALAAGNIRCWGGPAASLGIGATEVIGDDEQPNSVSFVNTDWTAVSLSTTAEHTCAVTTTGGVYCWGATTRASSGMDRPMREHSPRRSSSVRVASQQPSRPAAPTRACVGAPTPMASSAEAMRW